MKKTLQILLVGILAFLGFNLGVNADTPPKTFVAREVILLEEYVPGIVSYYKPIDGGLEVFCEDEGLTYLTNLTYGLWEQVDDGYIYIFEHRPSTGNSKKNYYIQSVAVWWYKDYLNNNNTNIPKDKKDYIISHKDSDEVCKLIYNLVEGAKKYKQSKGTISFSSANVNFTEDNEYYISDKITVESSSLKTFSGLKLEGAPTGTTIINSTINNKQGKGTFQIKVPKSALNAGQTVSFKVSAAGTYEIKKMYDYYIEYNHVFSKPYQHVIYGKTYADSFNTSNSKSLSITKGVNKLSITKVDESGKALAGATLVLYKGDCTKGVCKDEYTKWESTTSAKEFSNIPVGKYTLMETKSPVGYRLADKMLINIDSDSKNYSFKLVNKKSLMVRISKTDITGDKEVPGATLVLKDEKGTVLQTWISTTSPKYYVLEPGVYTLNETIAPKGYVLNESTITFKLDADGTIYEKDSTGKWVKVDYVKMINEKELTVRISKTDITGEVEVPGASLVLKDEKGNTVSSWVSTTEPHYETLKHDVVYELTETVAPKGYVLSKSTITFKLDKDGKVYEKNAAGEFTLVDFIKMVNVSKSAINISKLDSETNEYVSGATLVIKNLEGKVIANWTTSNESHYVSLDEGEYVLTETISPKGYLLNNNSVAFKVDADGNLFVKDSNGNYSATNGLIMYNDPEKIDVPATGLTSTLTYVVGSLALAAGAIMLYRNEKKC